MQAQKFIIRKNESGWVIYREGDVDNFKLFRANEPERFIKFVCETVAGIKVDALIARREEEKAAISKKLDEQQVPK